MIKYKLINAKQDKLEVNASGDTDIVIFPVGKHDVVAGSAKGPQELTVNVDEKSYNNIISYIKATYNDIKKLYSDVDHTNQTVTSYLQSLRWDISKGIIATVKLTEKGLAAIKNEILPYFSPSFYVDGETIIGLAECFGALCDSPAFEKLKEYPIQAVNFNKNNMDNKDIKSQEEVVVKAVDQTIPPTTDDKEKTEEVKPTTDDTEKKMKEMVESILATKGYVAQEQLEKWCDDYMAKKGYMTTVEATKAIADGIKPINDTIIEVNAMQCKINDKIKVISETNKKALLEDVIDKKERINASKAELGVDVNAITRRDAIKEVQTKFNCNYGQAFDVVFAQRPELWRNK